MDGKSSLEELVKLLRDSAASISEKNEDTRVSRHALFREAIDETMQEIKAGAPSEDFADLVVINFIVNAFQAHYTVAEIKSFMDLLVPEGMSHSLLEEEDHEDDEGDSYRGNDEDDPDLELLDDDLGPF